MVAYVYALHSAQHTVYVLWKIDIISMPVYLCNLVQRLAIRAVKWTSESELRYFL